MFCQLLFIPHSPELGKKKAVGSRANHHGNVVRVSALIKHRKHRTLCAKRSSAVPERTHPFSNVRLCTKQPAVSLPAAHLPSISVQFLVPGRLFLCSGCTAKVGSSRRFFFSKKPNVRATSKGLNADVFDFALQKWCHGRFFVPVFLPSLFKCLLSLL